MLRSIGAGAALLLLTCLVGPAAAADMADHGWGARHHHGYGREDRPDRRYRGQRRLTHAQAEPIFAEAADPALFVGADLAAPAFGPIAVVEYRAPYIPRGVIYNVPPQPVFAHGHGYGHRRAVIRAKY
jgi:hypothetical protein